MVTTSQFSNEDLDKVLGSRVAALKSSILATEAVDEQYLNQIEFKTSDDAKDFYKSQRISPTKGCKLFVEATLTHRKRTTRSRDLLKVINLALIKRTHAKRRGETFDRVWRLDRRRATSRKG